MSATSELKNEINLIREDLGKGRNREAMEKLGPMLENDPGNFRLLYLAALATFSMDRFEESRDYAVRALEKGCAGEEVHLLLGRVYTELNVHNKAQKSLVEAIKLNRRNPESLAAYAYILFKLGHGRPAARYMKEAMQIDREDENVLYYNFLLTTRNKRDNQFQALKRLVLNSGEKTGFLVRSGLTSLFGGEPEEARKKFLDALALNPGSDIILSMIQAADFHTSPFFLPQRIMEKAGGSTILWTAFLLWAIILYGMGHRQEANYIILLYFSVCVYGLVLPGIYRAYLKRSQGDATRN